MQQLFRDPNDELAHLRQENQTMRQKMERARTWLGWLQILLLVLIIVLVMRLIVH